MNQLTLFFIIRILSWSRFNLNNLRLSRSYYDLLSLGLIGLLCLFYFLSNNKWVQRQEQDIESKVARLGHSRYFVFDVLLLVALTWITVRFASEVYLYPIRCQTADMLPMIREAGEHLLRLTSPFDKTYCNGSLPYTYLPMMILYYLPGTLLSFDLRFLSHLYFLLTLGLIYWYYRKNGRPLAGSITAFILLSSILLQFFLLSVQDFPFLWVLSLVLYSLAERKDRLLCFSMALAAASRHLVLLFLPLFVVFLVRSKKVRWNPLKYFLLGTLLGYAPALLFPKSFVLNFLTVLRHFNALQRDNLFLKHSLGFAYYFFQNKTISAVLSTALLVLIYFFALKFLKAENLHIFLIGIMVVFVYFLRFARPEEYYFLPLIAAVGFAPIQRIESPPRGKSFIPMFSLVCALFFMALMIFPFLVGKRFIYLIRGQKEVSPSGVIHAAGSLEFSLGEGFRLSRHNPVTLLIKRKNADGQTPGWLSVDINDKEYLNREFRDKEIHIAISPTDIRRFFVIRSNLFRIKAENAEPFSLKIIR